MASFLEDVVATDAPDRKVANLLSDDVEAVMARITARQPFFEGTFSRGDVNKLDRLGRDAIDVSTTVAKMECMGIRVHCLALGGGDLTSSAGKLTMGVINAVAQFERDLLIERTQSGLARAKAQGKPLGRPAALTSNQQADVRADCQGRDGFGHRPRFGHEQANYHACPRCAGDIVLSDVSAYGTGTMANPLRRHGLHYTMGVGRAIFLTWLETLM